MTWDPPPVPPPYTPVPDTGPVSVDGGRRRELGFGANVVWGWEALRKNYALALGASLFFALTVVGGVLAALLLGAVGLRVRWLFPLSVLLTPVVVVGPVGIGVALCLQVWARATGVRPSDDPMNQPASLAGPRIGAVIGVIALLAPVALLPFTGGFVLVALHMSMGGGLGPVAAVGEALSRVTDNGRAFWHTVLVGFLISLYGAATLLVISVFLPALVGSVGLSVVGTGSLVSSSDSTLLVVTLTIAYLVAFAFGAGFFQFVGFATAAWTCQLGGERVGPPVSTNKSWHAKVVLAGAALFVVVMGLAAALTGDLGPTGYTAGSSGLSYRFVDDGPGCTEENGCFFVEVNADGECPEGVEVAIEETTTDGDRLGETRGSADPGTGSNTVVAIPSLSAEESEAKVTDIACR